VNGSGYVLVVRGGDDDVDVCSMIEGKEGRDVLSVGGSVLPIGVSNVWSMEDEGVEFVGRWFSGDRVCCSSIL
jgi:hypothetical protein